MGEMVSRKNRELTTDDIQKISDTYKAWKSWEAYEDTPWYCKSASIEEIAGQDYILTPGRYVGVVDTSDDDETFEAKMQQYTAELSEQFNQEKELDERIKKNLESIWYKI